MHSTGIRFNASQLVKRSVCVLSNHWPCSSILMCRRRQSSLVSITNQFRLFSIAKSTQWTQHSSHRKGVFLFLWPTGAVKTWNLSAMQNKMVVMLTLFFMLTALKNNKKAVSERDEQLLASNTGLSWAHVRVTGSMLLGATDSSTDTCC